MILGTKARYAVMAMVELARHDGKTPITLAQLASSQEITLPYLEQIFSKLKQRGIVRSVRGPGGGYVLAQAAKDTRIIDIVQAVDESLKMTRCDKHNAGGCMASKAQCITHDLWDGLEQQIHSYLSGITLADVLTRKLPAGLKETAFC